MEPFTLDRRFLKRHVIDEFSSIIWTERYYGDSEVELVVPLNSSMVQKLQLGTFLGLPESNEVMILETVNIEGGQLKFKGISLLQWMNNRFVRASASHEDRYWVREGNPPGYVLWEILFYMTHPASPYLDGTIDIGIADSEGLAIQGLGLADHDLSGDPISVAVPYGPVYDAMKEIATTYEIGMQILLVSADESGYFLGFRSYRGLDRTSGQTLYPPVRFSPQMDSFTGIKELISIAPLKTLVYAFAPGLKPAEGDPPITTIPGESRLSDSDYTGFDLRAMQIFADDITTDRVGGDPDTLVLLLNSRAYDALTTNHFVRAVDGEIVPESLFKYGIHYNLGDIFEVQGNTGAIQTARITEYIRSQDPSGEKAYPTVAMID